MPFVLPVIYSQTYLSGTLNYQSTAINSQFKTLPADWRHILIQISGHFSKEIKAHSKFISLYQFSGIQWSLFILDSKKSLVPGADPGFQVRGVHLKKIAPSGGRRENFWDISCEKSRFYAKKILFFPILGGARAGCASRWIRPWVLYFRGVLNAWLYRFSYQIIYWLTY